MGRLGEARPTKRMGRDGSPSRPILIRIDVGRFGEARSVVLTGLKAQPRKAQGFSPVYCRTKTNAA